MKCRFIDEHGTGLRVKKMCRVLGISRSTYYAWRKRPQCLRKQENEGLLEKIKSAYQESRMTHGSPRITRDLRDNGSGWARRWRRSILKQHKFSQILVGTAA